MSRATVAVIVVALASVGLWPASALNADPAGPVLNGEFEVAAEAARPLVCLAAGDGYVNIFQPGNPLGLPWLVALSPCQSGALKALGWSSGMATQFADWDGDGDREAKVLTDVTDPNVGAHHNFWQSYANGQQAWVADFEELRFRVEGGAVPPGAAVILSLSETPLSDVTPWVGLFLDCGLVFPSGLLAPDALGRVRADPVDAQFYAAWEGCADEAAAWAAGDAAARRAVLAKLRIVQHSFWNFNTGAAPVLLDGVELLGARTAAEAALGLRERSPVEEPIVNGAFTAGAPLAPVPPEEADAVLETGLPALSAPTAAARWSMITNAFSQYPASGTSLVPRDTGFALRVAVDAADAPHGSVAIGQSALGVSTTRAWRFAGTGTLELTYALRVPAGAAPVLVQAAIFTSGAPGQSTTDSHLVPADGAWHTYMDTYDILAAAPPPGDASYVLVGSELSQTWLALYPQSADGSGVVEVDDVRLTADQGSLALELG